MSQDLRLSDLPLLKEWDLDRLGITLMGHKKKLLKAFQQSLNRIASTPPRSFSAAQRVPPHTRAHARLTELAARWVQTAGWAIRCTG